MKSVNEKTEKITCLVDYHDAGLFFIRLTASDKKNKYRIITNLPSIFLIARKKKIDSTLIKKNRSWRTTETKSPLRLKLVREHVLGILNQKECELFYKSCFEELIKGKPNRIYCWNGNSVMGEAARNYATEENIKTLFFEIANIPGKVFIDKKGTNAQSLLFEDPTILDNPQLSELEIESKLKTLTDLKDRHRYAPQSSLSKKLSSHHLINFIFCSLYSYKTHSTTSVTKKLKSLSLRTSKKQKNEPSEILPNEYLFFPMQVSNDTQLMLNSDFTNIQAIEYILANYSAPIVVKPHPADQDALDKVLELKEREKTERLYISNMDTIELIRNSNTVVTINSTVGFEALLLNKETIFLGKSFYASFDKTRICNYFSEYLIDADFFSSESTEITTETLHKIEKGSQANLATSITKMQT